VTAILGMLAACAAPPRPAGPAVQEQAATPIVQPRARWQPVAWRDLPGWGDDRALALWPALRLGCAKPPAAAAWSTLCARALASPPGDDAAARGFIEREMQPYRVQTLQGDSEGLATGYFEPLVVASRTPRPGFGVPLYRPPADLGERRPYWTRQQIDTLAQARAALRGREIAWVASPLDALLLQVQGSGRLRVSEPDGRERLVRVAYAGSNDRPYRSVGAWLIEQGELPPGGASWPAIQAWAARATPQRLNAMLWSNPRFVFFREEPVADPAVGPRGALGVPLTAGRSVAVDPLAVPLGTVLWLDTTEPLTATPLRRLVIAQDTGSAIVGAVRIDYFWGDGDVAEQQAGRMKQALRLWALWPRSAGQDRPD
jgi:membrane-bound lytic murein transglycosylase A